MDVGFVWDMGLRGPGGLDIIRDQDKGLLLFSELFAWCSLYGIRPGFLMAGT